MPAEEKLPEVERYLVGSVWALCHLARYTMYLPLVRLVFPNAEMLNVVGRESVHRRVRERVVELSSYSVVLEHGPGAWHVGGEVARLIFDLPTDCDSK